MPTIIDLGQKVKSKYPGVYDDFSDLELGQRIKSKYPGSYNDFTDINSSQPQEQIQEKKSIGGFLGNVVESGANTIGGLAEAIAHPIQTVKGLGSLIIHPSNLLSYFKQRYGSLKNIQETAYKDPVGFAIDASTILGGAGTGLKLAGRGSKLTEAGNTAIKAGELTNPLRGLGATGGILSKGAESTAEKLTNYGLKIPASKARAGISKFILENRAGYKTAQGLKEFATQTEERLQPQIETGLKQINAKNGFNLQDIANNVVKEFNKQNKTRFNSQDLINDLKSLAKGHEYIVSKNRVGGIEANALRRGLDTALKTEKGKTFNQTLSLDKQLLQKFNNTLRDQIQTKTATRAGFAEQSGAIGTRKAVKGFQAKEITQGRPGIIDIVSYLGGGGTGVIAERILRSGYFLRATGQAIYDLKSFASFLSKKAPAERLKYLNTLNNLIKQNKQNP